MKARSAKNKGDRFEKYLLKRLRQEVDRNAHQTKGSGAGLDKNDLRIPSLDIEIEAKNAATFNIQGDWEQTKRQRSTGNMAVLAIRHPKEPEFKESVVVVDLEDFIELLRSCGGDIEVKQSLDSGMKYKIHNTVQELKVISNYLEGL